MNTLLLRLKSEPAVVVGAIAAAIIAAVQALNGANLIGTDIADFVDRALSPNGGWLLPIVVGLITRYFVWSPASHNAAVQEALMTPVPAPDEPLADPAQ